MSTRARKIPELPTATSIAGSDLLIVEKVTSSTTSTTSKVTAEKLVDYLITSPLGFGNVAGNIIPSGNGLYNIGSNVHNWNTLYVSNTVLINNTALTINSEGNLVVGDVIVQNGVLSNTNANWETANTVLDLGQAAVNSNTFQFKIGDGSTAWHDLQYASMGQTNLVTNPTMGGDVITSNIPGYSAWLAGSDGGVDTYYPGYGVVYGGAATGNTETYDGSDGGGAVMFGGGGALTHDNTLVENIYYTGDNDVHVTIANHNLNSGNKIYISGVTTETKLNGSWFVEYQDSNNFRLCESVGPYGDLIRFSSIGLDPWDAGGGRLTHSTAGGDMIIQAGYPWDNSPNYGKRGNVYIDGDYTAISSRNVSINGTLSISGDIFTSSRSANVNLTVANSTWSFSNTGTFTLPKGSLVATDQSIEVIVDDLTLSSTVDYSTGEGDNLAIGDYGLPNGIAHPWIVYEFTTTPAPVLQLDDIISGAGIPVGSTVLFVGSGSYSKIVITNVAQPLELPVAQPNITVSIVRPIINAALAISTPANTNIALIPGTTGFITNHSSIIPDATNIYDLGSPLRRFKTLWLGGSSIYIVDETLGVDQRLTAIDGNFVIAGGAGMKVGEFTLRDNNILLANTSRDINIGTTGATGHINFRRTINVKNSTDEWDLFKIDQVGSVEVLSDISTDPTKSAMSIVSARTRDIQSPNNLGVLLHLTGSSTAPSRIYHDSYGAANYSAFIGRHARGNSLTPTQTLAGDIISRVGANPFDDTGFASISTMRIDFVNQENQTTTARGSEVQFWTTPVGSTTIGKRLTINENGLKYSDNSVQNTAFNATSAVTKINVGTGLTQSGSVGIVGIDSTGVLIINGTENQINATRVAGNVALSLPQNIDSTATVQFYSLTVTDLIVTGSTTEAATLSINDKVIHLAVDSTSDTQIDGGGFTLGNTAAAYSRSILYDLPNDRWDTDGAGLKTKQLVANGVTVDSLTTYGDAHFGAAYLGYDFNSALIQADSNVNSYTQLVIKNHNSGTLASADVIAVNDLGDDSSYYIDMGINSSTYSNPDYDISGPNGGYLYNVGGDLSIGTATSNQPIIFFSGGTKASNKIGSANSSGWYLDNLTVVNNINGNIAGNANNAYYLNGTVASGYQTTAGLSANVATLTSNNSSYAYGKTEANLNVNSAASALTSNNSAYLGGTAAAGYQTTAGLSANVATLTSNNSTYAYGKTEGTLNVNSASNALNANNSAYLGGTAAANYVNTTGNFSLSGNITLNGITYVNQLSANGSSGTAGQVLTSTGTDTYWSTQIPDEQVFILAANRPLANQTALQSALGVGVSLESTTRYRYRFILTVFKSSSVSTAAVTYALGGNAVLARHYFAVNPCDGSNQETPTTTLQMSANRTANFGVATTITGSNGGATYYTIIIDGVVDVTTGGTIIPEIGFTSTAGTSCLVQAGASFEIYPVSATGANTSVGTWA